MTARTPSPLQRAFVERLDVPRQFFAFGAGADYKIRDVSSFAMTSDLFGDDGRLGRRFWLLGLAQAAHSMEEMGARLYDFMWIATERLGLPPMGMSATTFALVNMGIIAFLLGTAPFVAAKRSWAIGVAWIAAIVEIANGVGHLTGIIIFGGYVPGAITAPLLITAGIALLRALARDRAEA